MAIFSFKRSCPMEWLSIRIRLVKVALAIRSLRRCEGRQRSSMGLHLSVVCLIQSYPDAGSRVVCAVDKMSPHDGSSQVGPSYV